MKVVKISANFPPKRCGIGDYTRLLCENMADVNKGLYFYIITSAHPEVIQSNYQYERITVLPLISGWTLKSLPKIRKLVKEISPDVIHIEYNQDFYGRTIAMNFLPYFLKKDNPLHKIIITFHDLPRLLPSRDPFFWLTSLSSLICSNRVIVTNDNDFNSLVCRFPFIKRKSALVPVGSNIPRVEGEKTAVKKELNISEDTLVLSFFGFMREDKSLADLLYAFSELLSRKDNLRLLIIGGVLEKHISLSLQSLSFQLKIKDKIIWTDYQSGKAVSRLLLASDIAVLPYKDGIGTNSGAFAACVRHNLPIVATKAKFIPQVIRNGYNLMLVKAGDIKELTDVLFRLIEEPALRKRLSANLQQLNDYLSWQMISQQIFKFYTELYRK